MSAIFHITIWFVGVLLFGAELFVLLTVAEAITEGLALQHYEEKQDQNNTCFKTKRKRKPY